MPLTNLNHEQYKSATSQIRYNLTIASAGTGKTSTIVGRIAHLLQNNIPPNEILLLTFTNKAASEMVSRVAAYFSQEIASKIVSGTFHSVSYKLMKSLDMNVALKRPSELKTLFKSLYEKRIFPTNGETTPYDSNYLYDLYSLFLNSANNNEDFETWICEKNIAHKPYVLIYQDLFDEFNHLKKEHGYVNFDDLLLEMLEIQKTHKFQFYEILVDEYQDTNPLQGRLLEGFHSKNLFCVGDYDQSIYAFNGSDIGIISSFHERYSGSEIHTLTKNYRSIKPILDLANKVINFNERIYEKKLEVVRESTHHKPTLLAFDELYEQYEYISSNIQKSTTPHSDIAVIYRNNSSADGIEANLRDLGIKSKRKGGHSFFDSREIKFVLDFLVLLTNANDMMAFIHIIEYGKNIGKGVAKDIFDALLILGDGDLYKGLLHPNNEKTPYKSTKTSNVQLGLFDDFIEMGSLSKFKNSGFSEAFLGNPFLKHPKLTVESGEYLYQFYTLFRELKRMSNPANLIDHIKKSKIFGSVLENLGNARGKQKDGTINQTLKTTAIFKANRKVETLKQLSHRHTNIKNFINAMVLGGGELSEGEGVNLLSIHASKGLEFKEVYIIDLMDGRFPNRTLMSKGGSIEEERRLFYVAVTRAKDILYLSYAKYDKIKKQDFIYSPFLVEAGLVRDEPKVDDESEKPKKKPKIESKKASV